MLQQDPQNEAETPAAQRRVQSEELAKAISAIEASRQEEAQRLEGTATIGEIVQELQLASTPENILAEIQKPRADFPPQVNAIRTVRLDTPRPAASQAEDEDGRIETLHRSTGKDTKVVVGVFLVALLLCLLGLAISLTSTPKPRLLPPPPPVNARHSMREDSRLQRRPDLVSHLNRHAPRKWQ